MEFEYPYYMILGTYSTYSYNFILKVLKKYPSKQTSIKKYFTEKQNLLKNISVFQYFILNKRLSHWSGLV